MQIVSSQTGKTHLHMMATCSYAKTIWRQVELSHNEQGLSVTRRNIKEWWRQITKTQGQVDHEQRARLITYTAWNLWKERCRRVFDNKACTTQEIIQQIANDVNMLQMAQEEY